VRSSLLALAVALSACRGSFMGNRLRDAGDIFDVKLGGGLGVGAKVEASTYLGVGAGAGLYSGGEKFGRTWEGYGLGELFLHSIVWGFDARKSEIGDGPYVLGINTYPLSPACRRPWIARWRF